MKHIFRSFFLLIVLFPILSIAQEAPQHRVVYLWDVTYSMHGGYVAGAFGEATVTVAGTSMMIKPYNKKRDIYDKIMEALIKDIKNQKVESEIIVVPFNDKVLDEFVWRQMGTADGKKILENNIRSFYNKEQTKTNLCAPFNYSKKLFLPKAKYYSELKILTDGEHNFSKSDDFYKLLNTWCDFAEPNNIKGYYFVLAEEAISEKLRSTLHDCTCIELIDHFSGSFENPNPMNQFAIKGDQLVNLKDQYNKPIRLSVVLNDVERPIQGTEKVRIYASSNPYFEINETVVINGKATVEVTPKPKMSLVEMQKKMPVDKNTVVTLNFEQIKGDGKVNELVNNLCELRYVNKPQKTLTITIKQ